MCLLRQHVIETKAKREAAAAHIGIPSAILYFIKAMIHQVTEFHHSISASTTEQHMHLFFGAMNPVGNRL